MSLVEVFRQKGMKFYGAANIIPSNSDTFAELGVNLLAIAGDKFEIRNLILVRVERCGKIIAPSYKLFPDIDEKTMMAESYRSYGVSPR